MHPVQLIVDLALPPLVHRQSTCLRRTFLAPMRNGKRRLKAAMAAYMHADKPLTEQQMPWTTPLLRALLSLWKPPPAWTETVVVVHEEDGQLTPAHSIVHVPVASRHYLLVLMWSWAGKIRQQVHIGTVVTRAVVTVRVSSSMSCQRSGAVGLTVPTLLSFTSARRRVSRRRTPHDCWLRRSLIQPLNHSVTTPLTGMCTLVLIIAAWAPCGLQGCKNEPAPFPGRMSYKASKPGLVSVLYLSMFFLLCCCLLGPFFIYC